MSPRKKIILTHMLVWALFIAYEVTLLHVALAMPTPPLTICAFYAYNISLFYFNAHVILDFSFFKMKRHYLFAVLLIALEICVYLAGKCGLDSLLAILTAKPVLFTKRYLMINLWRCLYFIGLSVAYWSMLYMRRFRERNYQVEKEQLMARSDTLELNNRLIMVENAYLQNQISPHLLFNSLNFIYNTVYQTSEKAGRGIMRLSDIMRYSLRTVDDSEQVLVSAELQQIQNLVELCRLRFGEDFYLKINKKSSFKELMIIPLVLITLVENMMKHGDLGDRNFPAQVSLHATATQFSFVTRNRKRSSALFRKSGLGLANIRKRLVNFYQDKYVLKVVDEEDFFTADLTIIL